MTKPSEVVQGTIRETSILPNGARVEFEPLGHTYWVDGQQVPSVTQLIQTVYGNSYARVKPDVLQRAAEYGSAVHAELQKCIELRKAGMSIDLDQLEHQETVNYFKFIEPIYQIEPILVERVVTLYGSSGDPLAAGRFDLFAYLGKYPAIMDFKTTSAIHRPEVTAQLNLYLRAARQSGYLDQYPEVSLGVIHLSGETCRYVPIPILADAFIQRFEY